ncbi:protein of unknown function [Pelagibacterium halotolerans]|nr:protein of unknown function [Pelagibacterium halotolerans]
MAVSSIFSGAGALSEVVQNDYGEDLIVQTTLGDSADNFTILVQVKGTRKAVSPDGKLRMRFDVNHLFRWAAHIQPVLVCVYSDISEKTYAFSPRSVVSLWEMATSPYDSKTIKLSSGDELDIHSALRFLWDCRIEYYSRMLAWRIANAPQEYGIENVTYLRKHNSEVSLILFSFLKDTSIVVGDVEFSESFKDKVSNATHSLAADPDMKPKNAIMLAILGHIESTTNARGIPGQLAEHLTEMVIQIYGLNYPEQWAEIVNLFTSVE